MATQQILYSSTAHRRAGVLMHPTSLPSGVLNEDVERWLHFLADNGFSVWQLLPLGEPQIGLSPYQCISAFAMNPLLLNEYPALVETNSEFIAFCNTQKFWLDDYALFKILKQRFNNASWIEWPEQWKHRTSSAIQTVTTEHKNDIDLLKWQQYQLHKRWQIIKDKANELNIMLFGDIPIFVGYDSADVWAHPENFLLDSDGNMEVVSGVPPDYFSETGQRWGNPHYNWEVMQGDNFNWWRARVRHHLAQFDLVRIDHFRGLEAAWVIDVGCETAVDGHWQNTPGDTLLSVIQEDLACSVLPFVAEDLGIITPEVTTLRKKFQLPGMSVLQFGFDEFDDNPHKVKNITEDKIVYTGTHDNDTTKGWFNSLEAHVKQQVVQALNLSTDGKLDCESNIDMSEKVIDKFIELAINSEARTCIIPLQDLLYLDSTARMNTPGTIEGNWQWQFQWQQLENLYDNETRIRINTFIVESGRAAIFEDVQPVQKSHT